MMPRLTSSGIRYFTSALRILSSYAVRCRIERLELVRDVFIFCVYTGLAFIDVYILRPEHVSEDSNGNLWIVKPREKTNNLCNIPLLSIPKQILEKYKDNMFGANYIYTDGRNRTEDIRLERTVRHSGNFNASWRKTWNDYTFNICLLYTSRCV